MTYEEFVASKRHFKDISALWGGEDEPQSGWVYAPELDDKGALIGGFTIVDDPAGFSLIIGNEEWTNADIAVLERLLWDNFADGELNS